MTDDGFKDDDDDGFHKLDLEALADDGYNLYVEWASKIRGVHDKSRLVYNVMVYAVAAQYMIDYAAKVQQALIEKGHIKLIPKIDETELN